MTRWLGRLSAAFFVVAALFAGVPVAQAQTGQSGGCALTTVPKIVSASTYLLTSADKCDLVVLTNNGQITVQLPAPGLIFSPGWRASVLPINGGQITFVGQADQAGVTHKVNLQTSLLLSAGSGADLRVLQDMNWWAEARFSGSLPDAVAHNVLKIYPPRSDTKDGKTAWSMVVPDLSTVPNLSTTCSSGFNEAEAYAFTKGWSVELYSDGEYQGEGSASLRNYLSSNCAGGFVLKPLANRSVKLAAQILCIGIANAGCVNVDSMMKGKIICNGCEIGSQPTSPSVATTCGWMIKPQTIIPNEGVIGITDSEIDFGNVSSNSAGGTALAAVCVDISSGGVNQSYFHANEINTGGAGSVPLADYGFLVQGTNGTTSFAGNLLRFGHVHLTRLAAIQIGANTTNQQLYTGNIYNIGTLIPGFDGAQGINTFGRHDQFYVGLANNAETVVGSYQTPAFFHTGAVQNTLVIGEQSGASNGTECASIVDQTNSSINPASQNNITLNGQRCSSLSATGQINELPVAGLTAGTGAVCMAGFVCTNHRGTVDVGTGNPTAVTISFSITYLSPPKCSITPAQNGFSGFYRTGYTSGGGGTTAVQYSTNGGTTMPQHTQLDYECE